MAQYVINGLLHDALLRVILTLQETVDISICSEVPPNILKLMKLILSIAEDQSHQFSHHCAMYRYSMINTMT